MTKFVPKEKHVAKKKVATKQVAKKEKRGEDCNHEFENFFVSEYAGIRHTQDKCIHCGVIKK